MTETSMFSRIYLARVIVENVWGYHMECLWYGSDPKNLALTIMDVMGSWYLPNKDQMAPEIVEFYEHLADITADVEEGQPSPIISFRELSGEKFKANGLRLEVIATNNLYDMYEFVVDEVFDIFCKNNETRDDFDDFNQLAEHLQKNYEIEDNFIAAITNPNEMTIAGVLHLIDIKYKYTQRHYRAQNLS